jgi:hypothetical protein
VSELRKPWHYENPACAEVGVEIFFAIDRDEPGRENLSANEYSLAQELCKTCPHKIECAEWGIRNESHGVWGGLTPQQRSRVRSKNKIQLPVTVKTHY